MAGSVNKVTLLGHLGADPEVRRTQDGRAIVNLRLATSDTWRDKATGERREKTEWHRIVVYNEALAKTAEQYLRKGSKVYLEGSLQAREWEDQSGAKRFSTEVVLQQFGGQLVLLDSRQDGDREERPARDAGQRRQPAPAGGAGRLAEDMDDEIPFGPEVR